MGRRSINTTKGGKYMNPTDQAREFRKISTSYIDLTVKTIYREGGEEEGAEKEQEAEADGAGGSPEGQGPRPDTRGDGEDR